MSSNMSNLKEVLDSDKDRTEAVNFSIESSEKTFNVTVILSYIAEPHRFRIPDGQYDLEVKLKLEDSGKIPEAKNAILDFVQETFPDEMTTGTISQDYPTRRVRYKTGVKEETLKEFFNSI